MSKIVKLDQQFGMDGVVVSLNESNFRRFVQQNDQMIQLRIKLTIWWQLKLLCSRKKLCQLQKQRILKQQWRTYRNYLSDVTRITGKQLSLAPRAIILHNRLSWYIDPETVESSVNIACFRTSILFNTSFGCSKLHMAHISTTELKGTPNENQDHMNMPDKCQSSW